MHSHALRWRRLSREAGKPWVIAVDEPGDAQHALVPDEDDPGHDDARMNGLWGALWPAARLDLRGVGGGFDVRWFDPRTGTFVSEAVRLEGYAMAEIPAPPVEAERDWVVLVRRSESG